VAVARFMPPLTSLITGDLVNMEAETLRELCRLLILRYQLDESLFFDESGELSSDIVILINRRNAITLQGMDTTLGDQSEVLIMKYLVGG
jgi:molybdopterin converting factor small subunit